MKDGKEVEGAGAPVTVERLVNCSSFDKDLCPKLCVHRGPHKLDADEYGDDDQLYFCSDIKSTCGYRADQPMCICS